MGAPTHWPKIARANLGVTMNEERAIALGEKTYSVFVAASGLHLLSWGMLPKRVKRAWIEAALVAIDVAIGVKFHVSFKGLL